MSDLSECLLKLSKIEERNGTDPSLLQEIYDLTKNDSDLALLISNLPKQNRAGRRALARFAEKQLENGAKTKSSLGTHAQNNNTYTTVETLQGPSINTKILKI